MAKRTNININRIKSKLPVVQKGFTLIETMVAIAVLGVAIVGPLTLAIKSIGSAMISQDQITASYLAQEAIEYIKNRRDDNFLQKNDWLFGLEGCMGANGCYIDVFYTGNEIIGCSFVECPKIKFDSYSNQYNYRNGEETPFIRKATIITRSNDEAEIQIEIKWQGKYVENQFTLQDNIFNWKKF